MKLCPFDHISNAHPSQLIVHINYLDVIFPQTNCYIQAVITLDKIRWNFLRQSAASDDTNAQTFHKQILVLLSD
jgi:hypothetical protein